MNNQNLYYDTKDISETASAEPVTLGELKDYLRLEGFVDTDESTTDSLWDFDFDDTLLTNMIKAARKKCEDYCGCSFKDHTWKALIKNGAGDFELPYGPVQSITSVAYSNGQAAGTDAIESFGFDFVQLECPKGDRLTVIYEAGYDECPEEVRLAIMQMVSYWYEKRVIGEAPAYAFSTIGNYKRPWTWIA